MVRTILVRVVIVVLRCFERPLGPKRIAKASPQVHEGLQLGSRAAFASMGSMFGPLLLKKYRNHKGSDYVLESIPCE